GNPGRNARDRHAGKGARPARGNSGRALGAREPGAAIRRSRSDTRPASPRRRQPARRTDANEVLPGLTPVRTRPDRVHASNLRSAPPNLAEVGTLSVDARRSSEGF